MPRSSEWLLPLRFSDQNFVFLISLVRATYSAHLIFFDLISVIILKRTSYEVPHYAVFSSLVTLPPSQVQRL
jgi:hypothetical protein